MWGAARHDRATGVHRPLFADVLAFQPLDASEPPAIRALLDSVGVARTQYDSLVSTLAAGAGTGEEQVVVTFSHSHSAGFYVPDRAELPGGELIAPFLTELSARLRAAAGQAVSDLKDAVIQYGTGRCSMAANRDFRDVERGIYACGFNPAGTPDQTVVAARIIRPDGVLRATLVNYGCHPTTLAWENTLLSPDYPGATREVVEAATGAPCVFALSPCGDLGPRHGLVGDPGVADQNGRQLGYAALEVLESLDPPGADFAYRGPVISGATLGDWRPAPQEAPRVAATQAYAAAKFTVDLPLKSLPTAAELESRRRDWEQRQRDSDAAGDTAAARDAGAQAERARRWLGRIADLPRDGLYPVTGSCLRLGDAAWVTCGGEPYSELQTALRRRFPNLTLIVSPLAGALQVAYLLPRDRYGLGLYQEEPSPLAPGCLEALTDALEAKLRRLL